MADFTYVSDLGEGSFGRVLLVQHEGQLKALKVIKVEGDTETDRRIANRFRREIRVMADLEHPFIMPIEPTTTHTGGPAYFMPVADSSLEDLIEKRRRVSEEEALRIVLQGLDALAYIHSENIIHRDINPRNILLIDGNAILSDFGLTRDLSSQSATMTTMLAGTRGYMAPEQLDDAHDAKASMDIYAMGVVLHELVTGSRPTAGRIDAAVQGGIRMIIHKATSRRPENRYASASEFAASIQAYLSSNDILMGNSERFDSILGDYTSADSAKYGALHDFVAVNLDDPDMFLISLPKLPARIFLDWSSSDPDFIEELIHRHIGHLKNFSSVDDWSDVDPPITLISLLWDATGEDALKVSLLRPLCELSTRFHRYFGAETFARLVVPVASNPVFLSEIIALLGNDADFREMVRPHLEDRRIPMPLKRALA